jgi:hypothetical protein
MASHVGPRQQQQQQPRGNLHQGRWPAVTRVQAQILAGLNFILENRKNWQAFAFYFFYRTDLNVNWFCRYLHCLLVVCYEDVNLGSTDALSFSVVTFHKIPFSCADWRLFLMKRVNLLHYSPGITSWSIASDSLCDHRPYYLYEFDGVLRLRTVSSKEANFQRMFVKS